jgi:hypothetical protein
MTAITEVAEDGMVAVTDDGRAISPRVSAYFQAAGRKDVTVPVDRAVAAQRGCKHWMPGQKYGTPDQCGNCPALRGGGGQVAVPQAAEPDRTAAGTIARTAQPIDGARLLNIADAWMGRHVHMSDAARHTAILYTAAQHFRLAESGRLAWPRFGRILYVADAPGSGKTTAMILMGYMSAPWFYGVDGNPTAPGLCASINEERATLFLDEVHRLVGAKGTRRADVVTILNIGYEKNGKYLNARGGKANRVPVYAAAVLAGKDTLLKSAGEEISDLLDRCAAIVHMTQPPEDVELAEITDATQAQGEAIAAKLAAWAAEQMADVERFREAFTVACDRARQIGLTGRAKDVWVPLIATGWLASEGHADAACEAALEFRQNRPVQHEGDEDPLAGLEADLAGDGGELAGWG